MENLKRIRLSNNLRINTSHSIIDGAVQVTSFKSIVSVDEIKSYYPISYYISHYDKFKPFDSIYWPILDTNNRHIFSILASGYKSP